MKMNLTSQQTEAIKRGDAVSVVLPESQIECIIVRRERWSLQSLDVDYSPCPPDELLRVTAECVDDEETRPEHRRNPMSIIGVWKMDPPPNDADMERILEDELLRKYG